MLLLFGAAGAGATAFKAVGKGYAFTAWFVAGINNKKSRRMLFVVT